MADTNTLHKLNLALPRKVYFAYRSNSSSAEVSTAAESEEQEELNIEQLHNLDSFDCTYNGFKVLPRKVKLDTVDLTSYGSILRCILLRLEPVKRLRNAILDVTNALQTSGFYSQTSTAMLASTMKRLGVVKSVDSNSNITANNTSGNRMSKTNSTNSLNSNNNNSSNTVPKTPLNVKFANLMHKIDSTATKIGMFCLIYPFTSFILLCI